MLPFFREGPPGTPFEDELPAAPAAGTGGGGGGDEDERAFTENLSHSNMQRGATIEDIAALRARGITVD